MMDARGLKMIGPHTTVTLDTTLQTRELERKSALERARLLQGDSPRDAARPSRAGMLRRLALGPGAIASRLLMLECELREAHRLPKGAAHAPHSRPVH